MNTSQFFGYSAELYIMGLFRSAGFDVNLPANFLKSGPDMTLDAVLPVYVGTAAFHRRLVRPGYYRYRYQFNLLRIKHHRETLDDNALVCLLPYAQSGYVPYFVPYSELRYRSCYLALTSHPGSYSGYWSRYRENWSQVYALVSRCMSNYCMALPLPGMMYAHSHFA